MRAMSELFLACIVFTAHGQMGDWTGGPEWAPGSSQDTWWVPNALQDCVSTPPIQSYHVHVFYRNNNMSSIALAQKLHADFINATNPNMEECPHPHMDGATGYPDVCHFPASLDTEGMASEQGGFFGMPNYAFFIPRPHHDVAEAWWRQHHHGLDYFVHTNTGCQDPDHTIWPTVNPWSGWNIRLVDKSGLICCHTGPAGCRCDVTTYTDAKGQPLYSEGLGKSMVLLPTSQDLLRKVSKTTVQINSHGWASVLTQGRTKAGTLFRETVYDVSGDGRGFSQIEEFGDQNLNTYECIAVQGGICKAGAAVVIGKCSEGDKLATRFSWVDDAKSGGAGYRQRSGQLASDSCPGMCLSSPSNITLATLDECSSVSTQGWQRFGSGNKDLPQVQVI